MKKTKIHTPKFSEGERYGFIAQDVKEIFPEMVRLDSIEETYAINYDEFIPVLFAAIKEQQTVIEGLNEKIMDLEKEVLKDKSGSNLKSGSLCKEITETAVLYQNAPNPFSESTKIKFSIPQRNQSAMICIYNMNGT